MATVETWVLDGVALTGSNFEILDLNVDPPKARPDYITAADSEGAGLLRQPMHENRVVTMKLRVAQQASMNAALDQVGVILDKCRLASADSDGVALVWTPANSTRSVTFDVLAGEIPELPIGLSDHAYSWFRQRPIFTLALTCKPYWRGTETLTSTASSSTPITTLEIANVTGDVPALGRLIVTDTATQSRRHVEWGLEGPDTYNSGTSLILDSDSLVTTGFGGVQATATGAYDPNATGNNVVTASSLQILYSTTPLAIVGTGNQSHVGTFRVKARVLVTQPTAKLRFSWQVGDGPFRANAYASVAGYSTGFQEIDLGLISIAPVVSGTQRWTGRVEAYTTAAPGTVNVSVDYLLLIPVGEGYGKARGEFTYQLGTIAGRDEFFGTTAGGVLNARVAPAGGTWATSGSTTDFTFADAPTLPGFNAEAVTRATASDASPRFAILGSTNYTDVEVATTAWFPGGIPVPGLKMGTIARWTDSSNYLVAYLDDAANTLVVQKVVTGVTTVLASTATTVNPDYQQVRLIVFASGRVIAHHRLSSGVIAKVIDTTDSALATGGTLATGKPGFYDQNTAANSPGRFYGNFYVATPTAEPIALYSGRNMEVRHDAIIRQDSTGVYTGVPPSYRGSRFLVPPGTSRVLAKARRRDVDVNPDENVTDATQIQVGWTPRGLAVPR